VFFYISSATVAVNLGLMLALVNIYGILGPAIAMVTARFLATIAQAGFVMKHYDYSLAGLLPWADVAKVALLCLVSFPIVLVGEMIEIHALMRAILFASIYSVFYIFLLVNSGIEDVREFILRAIKRKQ
jgi:O-antigen/teichoic acid export membrane protein